MKEETRNNIVALVAIAIAVIGVIITIHEIAKSQ